MTRTGYDKLTAEYTTLLEEVRPKVVQGVADAAAEGDRSENAEYIYGKKRLREIDKKLRYLTGLMKDVEIIDPENIRSDRVEFGATVSLLVDDSEEKKWKIVGVGEADVNEGTISWHSPIAKAILGKKVGDFVVIHRPAGEVEVEVLAIEFKKQNPRET